MTFPPPPVAPPSGLTSQVDPRVECLTLQGREQNGYSRHTGHVNGFHALLNVSSRRVSL